MFKKTLISTIVTPAMAFITVSLTDKYLLPAIEKKVKEDLYPKAKQHLDEKVIPECKKQYKSFKNKIKTIGEDNR